MRKLIITMCMLAVLGIISLVPLPAHATSAQVITIEGDIEDANGIAQVGEFVDFYCVTGSGRQYLGYSPTGRIGHYYAWFTTDQCGFGSIFYAVIGFDLKHPAASGMVVIRNTHIVLNIHGNQAPPIYDVPEYTWAGATVATILGLGTIFGIRRRFV